MIIIIILWEVAGVPIGIPDTPVCTQMSTLLGTAHNYPQKGVASLSCGRELRFDKVYPARIAS